MRFFLPRIEAPSFVTHDFCIDLNLNSGCYELRTWTISSIWNNTSNRRSGLKMDLVVVEDCFRSILPNQISVIMGLNTLLHVSKRLRQVKKTTWVIVTTCSISTLEKKNLLNQECNWLWSCHSPHPPDSQHSDWEWLSSIAPGPDTCSLRDRRRLVNCGQLPFRIKLNIVCRTVQPSTDINQHRTGNSKEP